MQFDYERSIELGGGLLTRLDNYFSKKKSSGLIRKDEGGTNTIVQYYVRDYLQSSEVQEDFTITLEIASGVCIQKTIIDVPDTQDLNEYHLKAYISEMYADLLLNERSGQLERFVVRVYARYFNSRRIKGELLVNCEFKTLIKSPEPSASDKHDASIRTYYLL